MTKPITAAAVMILLERGEIDLFDPVSRFLEGFRGQMVCEGGSLVPAEREVNVRDLLSMTSGMMQKTDAGTTPLARKLRNIILSSLG